jgi:hypothetical protein
MFCLVLLTGMVQMGFCRGDKVIPQVADGSGLVTRFDLVNVSAVQTISHMRLVFYRNDGSKWNVQTNQSSTAVSEIALNLQPRQTLRVETSGKSNPTVAGYAVLYDEEPGNSTFSEDYVLGITVYYLLSNVSGLADAVTVSVTEPTALASMPMQMNVPQGISSGIAVVNRAGADNKIYVTLYSESGSQYGTSKNFTLGAGQKWSGYLNNNDGTVNLFPELGTTAFKGMAEISSTGPVALLTLLENRGWDGVARYSTLAAVDKESLRRNTYMILLQADINLPYMPIDLDAFTVDYFRNTDRTEAYPWDLEYRFTNSNTANRLLQPWNGATIAPLGYKSDGDFDLISLSSLKSLTTYSTGNLDLSGTNLYQYMAFAVRTDLGNYAKARIVRIINTTDGTYNYKDLVLEVCIYK